MDGTLWDNLDTYVKCWNIGLEKTGHDKKVTRDDLKDLMGKEARYMLNTILPEASQEELNKLFKAVIDAYLSMQGRMTPRVFPGVLEGLEKLSKKYKLYLVSNCEEGGLVNFMNYTNTRSLFFGLCRTWTELSTQKCEHAVAHPTEWTAITCLYRRYRFGQS